MSAVDGPDRLVAVAAVPDEPRLAGLLRRLQRLDGLPSLKDPQVARVKLQQVNVVRLQRLQGALDALPDRRSSPRPPAELEEAVGMVAGLGSEKVLAASV